MLKIDDPLLTLILRFVVDDQDLNEVSDEFIQSQIHALEKYIHQFPPPEQEACALRWVEQHAATYRRNWEKKVVSIKASGLQCADCPLMAQGNASYCVIHKKWLALLEGYMHDTIDSNEYVKKTLKLLTQHKSQLKIKRIAS